MDDSGGAARGDGFKFGRRFTIRARLTAAAVAVCMLALSIPPQPAGASDNGSDPLPVFEVRPTYTGDFGLRRPVGLAYNSARGTLLVAGSGRTATRVLSLTPTQDDLGTSILPAGDARTLAFDPQTGRAAFLAGNDLVTARIGRSARPTTQRIHLGSLGLRTTGGATFEPGGALLVLDADGRSIVRVTGLDATPRIARISLSGIKTSLRGIAFNPSDRSIYVMSPDAQMLYAMDRPGTITGTYTTESLKLDRPTGITFAPSADTTDDPANLNLFISDGGTSSTYGSVMEAKLTQESTSTEVPIVTANLVRTIDTSLFDPPSPDPAGIVFMSDRDRILTADSEVDETTGAGYRGVNLWQITRAGGITDTGTTLAYSREPTGLGFDPATRTLFVSSDDSKKVFVLGAGGDGRFGTSDDAVSSIDAAAYGSTDTEDPEFDTASGHLFFIDGINTEVYRIDPVNGVFGDADDVMTHFDVGWHGATDVEALGSDATRDTLLVGDRGQRKIYEVTKTGELVRIIDARVPGMMFLSGLGMAPASDNSGRMNIWTVDRAVDNGPDPKENDGKIFELSVDPGDNEAPVVSSVVINPPSPRTNDTLSVAVSAGDPDGDALTYSYQWNKNGVAIPGATGPTHDLSVAGNGNKRDRISVRVTVSDGQALGVRTAEQVTIINSFPVFNQDVGDRSNTEGESVSFSSGATDADGDTLAYEASGLLPGITINSATGVISGSVARGAAASSPYNVSVTVRDDASGGSAPEIALVQKKSGEQAPTSPNTMSLSYDSPPNEGNLLVAFGHASANRTPTIPAGWNVAVETGSSAETVIFYRIAGANEASTVTYSVSGNSIAMSLAIFEYAGIHSVQSEVLDRVAFATASNVTSVSTGTTQPTSQADELLLASIGLNATRTFQNSWANAFQQQTVNGRQTVAQRIVSQTGQFQTAESWINSVGAGTGAIVTFKRALLPPPDPDPGSATDSFTWTVNPGEGGGGPPVVNSVTVTPSSPRTNDTLAAQVDATDPDGDPLTFSYQWIKNGTDIAGATSSTLNLSQAGNGDKGDVISVRASASDGASSSAPVTSSGVTVQNSRPAFNQDLGDRTNSEGDPISLSAGATDADGDSLTYEASGLPGGLSIDPSTGLISGTIAAGAAAGSPYAVGVAVHDGDAVESTDTFSWTVNGVPIPAQPAGLTGTPTTTNTLLGWTANTEPDLAGYNVYRSESPTGTFTKLNTSLLLSTSFTDSTAPRGTSYYHVTAQNSAGPESIPAEVSVTRRIVLRSSSTRATKDTTSLQINRPSGVAAGDLMVAALDVLGTPAITAPTGWTLVRVDDNGSALRQAVYQRVATSDESKSYTWRFSTKASTAGIVLAYQGAATQDPITDGDSGRANPTSTAISASGVNTTVADTVLVGFFGMTGNPAIAPPAEMFERAEISQNGGPNKIVLEAADAVFASAGATGERTATGAQAQANIGQLVAIKPAL